MVPRLSEMGRTLVTRARVDEGEKVLDVACGSGNATFPAAQRRAEVTGLDITPELLEAGRAQAKEAGLEIEWVEGDAEDLPFDDESFDVVLSAIGSMFAPDHVATAREMARVARSGGRVCVASWTPGGGIGKFFKTVASHMPPPPDGFQPPILWGSEEHVLEIFEGTGVEFEFEPQLVELGFESGADAVEEFETKFGPVMTAKAALEPEGKWEALRDDLGALFEAESRSADDGVRYPGDYLLALGRKA